MEIHRPDQPVEHRKTETALPDSFVLGIWIDDAEAWIATSNGLGHGTLSAAPRLTAVRPGERLTPIASTPTP
jgi:hypothetical protein